MGGKVWIVSAACLCLLLHVPGDIEGQGQRWRAGDRCTVGGDDLQGVGLQAHLLVVVQLVHDDAAEVVVVPVTVVQELADLGGARLLVSHQFVILPHEHVAGQQRIQALVQTGLGHLGDDLLAPCRDPLGDWALLGWGGPQGRRLIGWNRGSKG